MDEARTRDQRRKDTLHRLENDVDAWVATASGDVPCLVPLSFHWDGEAYAWRDQGAAPIDGRGRLSRLPAEPQGTVTALSH